MPSDETRRLLKLFGVAVTEFEDAIQLSAPSDELRQRDAEVRVHLEELNALLARLRRQIDEKGS
jgi:hypothetical protein